MSSEGDRTGAPCHTQSHSLAAGLCSPRRAPSWKRFGVKCFETMAPSLQEIASVGGSTYPNGALLRLSMSASLGWKCPHHVSLLTWVTRSIPVQAQAFRESPGSVSPKPNTPAEPRPACFTFQDPGSQGDLIQSPSTIDAGRSRLLNQPLPPAPSFDPAGRISNFSKQHPSRPGGSRHVTVS
ncbi:hypothetical protein LZ30DRAFT_688030 [Colletotrichum cereale]|nr:hypothetical protein LZ30DRAFT_688030 [Colletotrichum cereale]